jgi:hypothetical protein
MMNIQTILGPCPSASGAAGPVELMIAALRGGPVRAEVSWGPAAAVGGA